MSTIIKSKKLLTRPFENKDSCPSCGMNRRQFLSGGAFLAAAAAAGSVYAPKAGAAGNNQAFDIPASNGSTDPFPVPWLDKNGSHNQSPGPDVDPSNIYHFKGRVARCNAFTGMGTDNKGNRIAFGAPSTDFSFLQGEYFAARAGQKGAFAHV